MIARILAATGGGTLAILALWGFLYIVGSSLPERPPSNKIGLALTMGEPKVRNIIEQPRIVVRPETGPFATTRITTPGPVPSLVSTVSAAPSPIPPRPPQSSQDPVQADAASTPADEPTGVIQPAAVPRRSGAPRCTRNRTYDAETQSYRGYDGLMHPCRS